METRLRSADRKTGFTLVEVLVVIAIIGVLAGMLLPAVQEGRIATQATYAAVTARSHHSGIVHVLLMDGCCRATSDSVQLQVWRALGTRHGGEPVTNAW